MIVLFTDFGWTGPYVGQIKAVLQREAPGVPVIDLMHDAPVHDARAASYLLASLTRSFPADAVFLCVVDPGVGSDREPVIAEIDRQRFVGPDNGLFEIVARQGSPARFRRITWLPDTLSPTFHGRDLFAPVAARLASGRAVESEPLPEARRPDWPDDLREVIYVDSFGNATTGMRIVHLPRTARIGIKGHVLDYAPTFSELPEESPFWYENSSGLVGIAVNRASAHKILGVEIGTPFSIL